ncbi:Fibrinogen C domain-containing protein 1 [Holothuria leucospilota]|uniref:Fibrinogen C domain-containing protein 1 n=1 Tax=Holothuria leucospilota TaxID=206669 RepID=A0A9Q1HLF9_HOLLE|nr:Fibrinogen C domain-containing protein 1 [Holothuria leucospilota]
MAQWSAPSPLKIFEKLGVLTCSLVPHMLPFAVKFVLNIYVSLSQRGDEVIDYESEALHNMGFYIHFKTFLFLFFVCVNHFGFSSAQTRNRGLTIGGHRDNNEDSTYYIYQSTKYPRDCREVRDQCSSSVSSGVYLIKPDGYPEPFEVYCKNDTEFGGWTVIQTRFDGSLDFNRNWEDYKEGFGFPSSEFWIGNDRLSFLTNQNHYELQIDMLLPDGSPFYLNYDSFRVSDEWGNYTFIYDTAGNFTGNAGSAITECPQNMAYYGCTCEATCEDPLGEEACQTNCDQNKACVCKKGFARKEDTCVNISECGCYISEENRYISNGETYVNADCTQKCTCNGNQLSCDSDYECSASATCSVGQNNVRQCYCNDGYSGDGVTCTRDAFKDCNEVLSAGNTQDGVYTIFPRDWPGTAFDVYCNMATDGGGWTVFQRRNRGSTGFYENWANYKNGFGDIQDEFWLGNEKIHYLTKQGTYELRVDFLTSSNLAKYAKYTSFRIDSVDNNYRVTDIGTYSGNGGYCQVHLCKRCSISNVNGDYNGGNGQNIFWDLRNNCNIKYTEMKVRRTS